jgi:hypothetical protein
VLGCAVYYYKIDSDKDKVYIVKSFVVGRVKLYTTIIIILLEIYALGV